MGADWQWENAAAGSAAGLATATFTHPLDVVRTRFQVNDGRLSNLPTYKSTLQAIFTIARAEGLTGLYAGFYPAVLGSTISWGLYFYFYNKAKQRYLRSREELSPGLHIASAAEAGGLLDEEVEEVENNKVEKQKESIEEKREERKETEEEEDEEEEVERKENEGVEKKREDGDDQNPPDQANPPAQGSSSSSGSSRPKTQGEPANPPEAREPTSSQKSHSSVPEPNQSLNTQTPSYLPPNLSDLIRSIVAEELSKVFSSSSDPKFLSLEKKIDTLSDEIKPELKCLNSKMDTLLNMKEPSPTPTSSRMPFGLADFMSRVESQLAIIADGKKGEEKDDDDDRLHEFRTKRRQEESSKLALTGPGSSTQKRMADDKSVEVPAPKRQRTLGPHISIPRDHVPLEWEGLELCEVEGFLPLEHEELWGIAKKEFIEKYYLMEILLRVCFCTNPVWLVKTRLQLQTPQQARPYFGFHDALRTILKEEGWRALYKGLVPGLFLVTHGAIQFTAYEELRRKLIKFRTKENERKCNIADISLDSFDYAVLGASSKLAAVALTYPSQVIRARLQQRPNTEGIPRYMDSLHVVKETARFEGLRGFYKGITANVLKNAPAASVTFIVYENVLNMLKLARWKDF
ncbi:hypothetical protein OROGR_008397 [Orobanche gracilis]